MTKGSLLAWAWVVLLLVLMSEMAFSWSLPTNARSVGGSGLVSVPKATVTVVDVNIYNQQNSQQSTNVFYVRVSLTASQAGTYSIYLELYNGGNLVYFSSQAASLSSNPTTLTFALPSQIGETSPLQVVVYAKSP